MKPETLTKIPQPPRPRRPALTAKQQYYLTYLIHWYKHRNRPPALHEIANLCRPPKSVTAVRTALTACEAKGYAKRDEAGRFMVVP